MTDPRRVRAALSLAALALACGAPRAAPPAAARAPAETRAALGEDDALGSLYADDGLDGLGSDDADATDVADATDAADGDARDTDAPADARDADVVDPELRALVARHAPDATVVAVDRDAQRLAVRRGEVELTLSYAHDHDLAGLAPLAQLAARLVAHLAGGGLVRCFEHETGGDARERLCAEIPEGPLRHASLHPSGPGALLAVLGERSWSFGLARTAQTLTLTPRTAPTSEADPLAPPRWLLPPSRRPAEPRSAPTRAPALTLAARAPSPGIPPLDLALSPPSGESSLLVVTDADSEMGLLACIVRTGAPLRCARSDLERVEAALPPAADGTPLFVASSSYGNERDDERLLVAASTGPLLTFDALSLGSLGGDGEYDDALDSYVVSVGATAHRVTRVEPSCVERRPLARWTADHVRAQRRWIRERARAPPRCADRFAIAAGRFAPATCGPAPAPRSCPEPAEAP
ncbi:MAG: hypothetical protein KF729_25630 [Sandaracinaceae bacterium]|nr:hypothetical protein [Sandaracinaceae bacterium]